VPLSHFIEQQFQSWTRQTSAVIGTVFLYVDDGRERLIAFLQQNDPGALPHTRTDLELNAPLVPADAGRVAHAASRGRSALGESSA
jgi:hypothetical protein